MAFQAVSDARFLGVELVWIYFPTEAPTRGALQQKPARSTCSLEPTGPLVTGDCWPRSPAQPYMGIDSAQQAPQGNHKACMHALQANEPTHPAINKARRFGASAAYRTLRVACGEAAAA